MVKLSIKNDNSKKILFLIIVVLILAVFSFNFCVADPLPPTGEPSNVGLIADPGGPYSGIVNELVQFDGSESTDTNGSIVEWNWSFGENGGIGTGAWPSWSYSINGTFFVTLTVTSSTGETDTATTTATIVEATTEEIFIKISNPTYLPSKVTFKDNVTISATITSINELSSVTLTWDDGERYEAEMLASGTTYSYNIGKFSSGITVKFGIEVYDIEGHREIHNGLFTVDDSTVTENVGTITQGEDKVVTPKSGRINKIKFQSKRNLQNVEIIIENLTQDDVKDYAYSDEGEVYWYFSLTINADGVYVQEDDIESSTIEFRVSKSWALERRTDSEGNIYNLSNITLFRYRNNQWGKLTTTTISELAEDLLFSVEVPGYSTFAVVGNRVIEKEQEMPDEIQIPWILIIGFMIAVLIILLVVLVRYRYIYKEEESEEKK